jgi:hypothetical protein
MAEPRERIWRASRDSLLAVTIARRSATSLEAGAKVAEELF